MNISTLWIKKAMMIVGLDDEDYLYMLESTARKESGGNSKIIVNENIGLCECKGLMLLTDFIFDKYKMKGYDDIYNPIDSTIACIYYLMDNNKLEEITYNENK